MPRAVAVVGAAAALALATWPAAPAAAAAPVAGTELALAPPRFIPAPASGMETATGTAGHLVVWSYGASVVARAIDAGGALGPTRLLADGGSWPQVAFNGTHYFVSWWDRQNAIWVLRLDGAGVPVDAAPIKVADGAYVPDGWDLACNPTACAIAFGVRNASNDSNVSAVRLSPAGAALDATPIAIATATGSDLDAAIASDGTDFLVSWVRSSGGAGGLEARRLRADGSLPDSAAIDLAPASLIAVYTLTQPLLAFDAATGNYDVVWDGVPLDQLSDRVLYLQRVSRTGGIIDATPRELARGGRTNFIEQRNAFLILPDRLLLFWSARDINTNLSHHLYSRALAKDGTPLGATLDLGPESLDASEEDGHVSLRASGGSGGIIMALWTARIGADTRQAIKMVPLDAGGAVVGGGSAAAAPTIVSRDVAAEVQPVGVWLGDGWFVVWIESELTRMSASLVGVRVSPSGEILDPVPVAITSSSKLVFDNPALATLGDGLVVAWREQDMVKALRLGRDGAVVDPTPILLGDTAGGSGGRTRLLPSGRDALAIVQRPAGTLGWGAMRIHEDGTVAPYALAPEDPRFGPMGAPNADAALVAGTPMLALLGTGVAGSTVDVWPLAPESALPPSMRVASTRRGIGLALGGGAVGGLAAWGDSTQAALGFVRLSAAGVAIDAQPRYTPALAGAPAAAMASYPVLAASAAGGASGANGGGWLAAWWPSAWGAAGSMAAPPMVLVGIGANGDTSDATLVGLDSGSIASGLALVAGGAAGGQALLLYQRPQRQLAQTARVFARLASWDGAGGVITTADGGPSGDAGVGGGDAGDAGARTDGAPDASASPDGGALADGAGGFDAEAGFDAGGGADRLAKDHNSGCGCGVGATESGAPGSGSIAGLAAALAAAAAAAATRVRSRSDLTPSPPRQRRRGLG